MIETIKKYYFKYKELILYVFFGGLTTLVNIAVYFICSRVLGIDVVASNVAAWLLSVLFAYVTNKLFVFESRQQEFLALVGEVCSFFACRLFSGVLDTGIMYLFVEQLGFSDLLIKILSNLVVIVINYLFSKLFIFRKTKKQTK